MSAQLPFTILSPDLATGTARDGWQPITQTALLILVGVTGVGKSTLLAQRPVVDAGLTLLPDRRDLTDRLIIPAMQIAAGTPLEPVRDRRQRFAYTRAYRERYPGGMAHALAQLLTPASRAKRRAVGAQSRLLFDGLRGENEVTFAATALPHARFVMLHAPDIVRVRRLLGRDDAFDQVTTPAATIATIATIPTDFAALGVPDAVGLFSADEARGLLALVEQGEVSTADLMAKLAIVAEERRNYDPAATQTALLTHAPDRTLVLDTSASPADRLARQLITWLNQD